MFSRNLTPANIVLPQIPPREINLGAFCGNIDDFRMYSRVLNSVEVNAIYKNTV